MATQYMFTDTSYPKQAKPKKTGKAVLLGDGREESEEWHQLMKQKYLWGNETSCNQTALKTVQP